MFRRIFCFTAAIGSVFVIYIIWQEEDSLKQKLISTLLISGFALFCVYVGIIGQGRNQYSFSDDIELYKKIRKTFKIR